MEKDDGKKQQKNIKTIDSLTDRLIKIMDVIYNLQEELGRISEEAHELLRERLNRRGSDRR